MQISLTHSHPSPRLILIFAGWGMDETPFLSLRHNDYDIAVAFDYRRLEMSPSFDFHPYSEICVLAWSFGVPAANAFMRSHRELPFTARIAVNGTLFPVDDLRGIPSAIFEGTLNGLSPITLTKFRRRMCGTSEIYATFSQMAPKRSDIDELADELRAIQRLPQPSEKEIFNWDIVAISDADRIIPSDNQHTAWGGHPNLLTLSGPHLPDFEAVLANTLKDKALIARRFSQAEKTYDSSAEAQRTIAGRLYDLIESIVSREALKDSLEIGCGTGLLTRLIAEHLRPRSLSLWDIAPVSEKLPGKHKQCDAETEIIQQPSASADLIASASTMQWFNSPSQFLHQCNRVLRQEGILAFSTFGPDNFAEMRPFLPASLHYSDLSAWLSMLSHAGFRIIKSEEEHIVIPFSDTSALLHHIKQTGVNSLSAGQLSTSAIRAILSSGITTLTYHPLYFIARV